MYKIEQIVITTSLSKERDTMLIVTLWDSQYMRCQFEVITDYLKIGYREYVSKNKFDDIMEILPERVKHLLNQFEWVEN